MFAHSFLTFSIFRFLTGIGLGVLMPIGVTYINEYAPRRLKQTFSTWGWALGFSIGGITASAVGVFLTPSLGWQSLYYVGSLSAVLAVVCHFALPESVQFSAMRGEMQNIARMLGRVNPSSASRYNAPDVQFVFPEPNNRVASMSLLLSPRYRRTTLAVCTSAFVLLFGVFGLSGWVPTVMIERGETFVTSFGFGALLMMTNFFGTLACGYVSDRRGSGRAALIVWWIGGSISVAILAIFNNHVLNSICVGAAGFFLLGGQGALNNLTASWYETEVRGTAVGVMLGIGRLGGVFGPLITGVIQQIVPGASGLFAAIGASAFIAAVAISFADPHPWGKITADLPVSP